MDAFIAWLKKYWEPLVGFLVLLAGFLLGIEVAKSKKPAIAPGPSDVQKDAEQKATAEEQDAARKRDILVETAQSNHDKDVIKVIDAETKQVVQIIDDPAAVNQFLLDQGKKAKGG